MMHDSMTKKLDMLIDRQAEIQNLLIQPETSNDINLLTELNKEFADIRNVHIIGHGSVNHWIYGAVCTIHSGCTTGLEAIAPKLPSPSIAEPLLITATKLPLVV